MMIRIPRTGWWCDLQWPGTKVHDHHGIHGYLVACSRRVLVTWLTRWHLDYWRVPGIATTITVGPLEVQVTPRKAR